MVLLAIEAMIILAPVLVLAFLAAKYVTKGVDWLVDVTQEARRITYRVQNKTLKLAYALISPIIAVHQFIAAGKGAIRRAFILVRGK